MSAPRPVRVSTAASSAPVRPAVRAALLAAVFLILAPALPGGAAAAQLWDGIDEVRAEYPGERRGFQPRAEVLAWAGEEVFLRIRGPLMPTASRVELRERGGGVLGGAAALIEDAGGDLGVRLTTNPALTPGGPYTLAIHFPTGGSRLLPVRIRERGTVTDIAHTGGALTYGMTAELTLGGVQIGNATLDVARIERDTGIRLEGVKVVAAGPGQVRIEARLLGAGRLRIGPEHVYDRTGPRPRSVARAYMGSGAGSFTVGMSPRAGGVSPAQVHVGDDLVVTGERLEPVPVSVSEGSAGTVDAVLHLRYPRHSGPGGSFGFVEPEEASSTRLRYRIPWSAARNGEYALVYRTATDDPRVPEVDPLPLPDPVTVLHPPRVLKVLDTGTGDDRSVNPTCSRSCPLPRLAAGDTVWIDGLALVGPGGAPPEVRFGSTVLTPHRIGDGEGDDDRGGWYRIGLRLPDELAGREGRLAIETEVGSWTSETGRIEAAPELTGALLVSAWGADQVGPGEGPYLTVASGELPRNRHYVLPGRHLENGDLRIGSERVAAELVTVAPDSVAFTLPLSYPGPSRGVLSVWTRRGEAALPDPVRVVGPPERLRSVELGADSLEAGLALDATVRFEAGDPPPDGTRVSLSVDDPAVLDVPATAEVRGGTAEFTVRAGSTAEVREARVTAALDGVSRSRALQVTPPRIAPASLTPEHRAITGDNPVDLELVLERSGSGYVVELESSRPDLLDVPPTVTVDGDRVVVTARSRAVTGTEEVRVTARAAGAETYADLTLSPRRPMMSRVELGTERVTGPVTLEGSIRIDYHGPEQPPITVGLRGLGGVVVPRAVEVVAGRGTFPVEIPAVAVRTRAGVAASSEVGDASAAFVVEPLRVELTVDPVPVSVRAPSRGALRVSSPSDETRVFVLRSSDPGAVAVPDRVGLKPGATEVAFDVTARQAPAGGSVLVEVFVEGATTKEPLASVEVAVGR